MLNLISLKHKILHLAMGQKGLQDVSDSQWELCPKQSAFSPPAIYLDGILDRISGVAIGTTMEFEIARILGGYREHRATTAYRIRSATLVDGYSYQGAMKYSVVAHPEPLWIQPEFEKIDQASLACSWCGNRYFGHWIRDDLPLSLAAEKLAQPIIVPKQVFVHEPDYRELFAIQALSVRYAHCQELIILDDVGQNSFKRERYEQLRSRLSQVLATDTRSGHGVMIRRGSSGEDRTMVNQEEVENFFIDLGFDILDQENLSALEISRRVKGAKFVVGIEGSHMGHGIFGIAEGGTILILQPPYRFGNVYKDYTDCLGHIHYAFLIGEETAGGFRIHLNELAKTLEKIV